MRGSIIPPCRLSVGAGSSPVTREQTARPRAVAASRSQSYSPAAPIGWLTVDSNARRFANDGRLPISVLDRQRTNVVVDHSNDRNDLAES